ncbi:MAG TPA: response regulator transcription factor [Mycobacteriales bacterium]|nr:response regulator transcription factor [Mycobacteriales bacterium]
MSPGTRVLVAEDDESVRTSIVRSLRIEGYEVEAVENGELALQSVVRERPDVIVMDVMMPELDGFQAVQRLRRSGEDVPVLMLTARDGVGDRVYGLDSGADDYLSKPFALEELLARLRTLVRRTKADPDEARTYADLRLDPATRQVWRGERELVLTKTEFDLVELFLENPKRVLTRSQILTRVWGFDFGSSSNSLEVFVSGLRRKLEEGGEPRLIHTVRGVGYSLRGGD